MTDPRIYFPNQPINTGRVTPQSGNQRSSQPPQTHNGFQSVFQEAVSGVRFSQHAQQRLKTRNIQLDQQQMEQLGIAVEKAAQKGAKESLVLMNRDLALVVSVTNRTVITAMDGNSIRENVFTNIDSAVII